MKKDLQSLISAYIASYRSSHPYSPTVREIAEGTGIPRATVGRTVSKMRSLGLLDYSGHRKILPAEQKPSVCEFVPVPVFLTPEARIRSVPDGTALLPSVWAGPGAFLFPAPGDCPSFGIRSGDPLLFLEGAAESGPVLCRTADDRLLLAFPAPDSPDSVPEILGTAVRTFRDLSSNR